MENNLGFHHYVCQVGNSHAPTTDISSYYQTHAMVYAASPLMRGNGTQDTPLAIQLSAHPHNGLGIIPKGLSMNIDLIYDSDVVVSDGMKMESSTLGSTVCSAYYSDGSFVSGHISYIYMSPSDPLRNINKTLLPLSVVNTICYEDGETRCYLSSIGDMVLPEYVDYNCIHR
ncbi:hypothetical protein [Xenorhabdus bharatensis]|uniref:hypothetical protein n=1 Tax=Xenorhabdus bharatensis TaxID=3136256 RepID=UPI0030F41A6A